MAEVAAARRPLLPPSSSSSLLPPPHRARPISLLAHATPQPARGRGREPRGTALELLLAAGRRSVVAVAEAGVAPRARGSSSG